MDEAETLPVIDRSSLPFHLGLARIKPAKNLVYLVERSAPDG